MASDICSAASSFARASPSMPSTTSRLARLEVVADGLEVRREVVVRRDVAADRLDDRRRVLDPELVRRARATTSPCSRTSAGGSRSARRGSAARARSPAAPPTTSRGASAARTPRDSSASPLTSSLAPEVLDGVPVAVLDARLQPAHERGVGADLLDHRVEVLRGRELGEVQHPVDLPVPVVDVDRVLEQHRQLEQRGALVVEAVEVREVALDLRPQARLPPVHEVRRRRRAGRRRGRRRSGRRTRGRAATRGT